MCFIVNSQTYPILILIGNVSDGLAFARRRFSAQQAVVGDWQSVSIYGISLIPFAPDQGNVSMSDQAVLIASDHGALDLKKLLVADLEKRGLTVLDLGTHDDQSVDYPDFAFSLARALKDGQAGRGVLLCGTGIGISIAANRFSHVRSALVHDAFTAQMARAHNDANVLVMGGRVIGPDIARQCLDIFLNTPFEGGRHGRRVEKLGQKGGE